MRSTPPDFVRSRELRATTRAANHAGQPGNDRRADHVERPVHPDKYACPGDGDIDDQGKQADSPLTAVQEGERVCGKQRHMIARK